MQKTRVVIVSVEIYSHPQPLQAPVHNLFVWQSVTLLIGSLHLAAGFVLV
jgi:hypothetical protein